MRNRLILAGKPSVLTMLSPKLCAPIAPENCRLWVTWTLLQDLIPLTWKCELAYQNGNSYKVNEVAAQLLHVDDHSQLLREYNARSRRPYPQPSYLPAQPGDFIVIMPLIGGTETAGADLPGGASEKEIRKFLESYSVQVVYVGEAVPIDVQSAFRDLGWKKIELDPVLDEFQAAIKNNREKKISVFDAHRLGMCLPGIEHFQKRYFPGCIDCTVEQLAKHLDAQPEVRTVLERFLRVKADGNEWAARDRLREAVKQQRSPIARELGLAAWL